ncbi:hypothetical protein Ptc2401_00551 [Prosthecochloris sp. CIB 2401]|nr:hypothetical protein Ptc2401_00551 [Prosthecochloris sp. CIB 2401]
MYNVASTIQARPEGLRHGIQLFPVSSHVITGLRFFSQHD